MALMQAKRTADAAGHTIFDAALGSFDARFFRPDYWQGVATVEPTGAGRGHSFFIDSDLGKWVLRHYCRGGKAALVSADRYLYTGLSRTRAFAEWRLLCALTNEGLPVPRPVAARVERAGLTYRADLITTTIPGTVTLSERLRHGTLDAATMQAVGHCIGRFHAAGVCHADLNAHNVLLDQNDAVYLIDFDRGRLRSPGRWRERNLGRLQRSLSKLQRRADGAAFDDALWQQLLSACRKYRQRP